MDEDSKKQVTDGYLDSHPYLTVAIAKVGAEAIAGINTAVGAVRPAADMFVNPRFSPASILD